MANVSRRGGTKNKYAREFNHLTTQLFDHLTRPGLLVTIQNSQSKIQNRHHTSPKIFHHTAATNIRIPNNTGVATRPTFVISEALKYL